MNFLDECQPLTAISAAKIKVGNSKVLTDWERYKGEPQICEADEAYQRLVYILLNMPSRKRALRVMAALFDALPESAAKSAYKPLVSVLLTFEVQDTGYVNSPAIPASFMQDVYWPIYDEASRYEAYLFSPVAMLVGNIAGMMCDIGGDCNYQHHLMFAANHLIEAIEGKHLTEEVKRNSVAQIERVLDSVRSVA